jgi:hypothetical protein
MNKLQRAIDGALCKIYLATYTPALVGCIDKLSAIAPVDSEDKRDTLIVGLRNTLADLVDCADNEEDAGRAELLRQAVCDIYIALHNFDR